MCELQYIFDNLQNNADLYWNIDVSNHNNDRMVFLPKKINLEAILRYLKKLIKNSKIETIRQDMILALLINYGLIMALSKS